jgi:hypothetical protein
MACRWRAGGVPMAYRWRTDGVQRHAKLAAATCAVLRGVAAWAGRGGVGGLLAHRGVPGGRVEGAWAEAE